MVQMAMVRAYRGEPLERAVIGFGGAVVYLAHRDRLPAVSTGESCPVGFPSEDVFALDAALFAELRSQWEHEGRTDDSLWKRAVPYEAILASREINPLDNA